MERSLVSTSCNRTCSEPLPCCRDLRKRTHMLTLTIAENFKLHVNDFHCRQIFFGGSHDNGFARLLEQYADDKHALRRVTLLEGVPFEKELAVLPFDTVKFPGIFRDTKINVMGSTLDLLTGQPLRPRVDTRGLSATSDVFTPRSGSPFSPFSPPRNGIPQLDGQAVAQRAPHLRTASIASSDSFGPPNAGGSWAAITKASSAMPFTDLPPAARTAEPAKTISRNIKGQRIDEPLDYDKDEVARLKKIKMCNQHYIGQGCCHWNAGKADKCPHRHDVKLTSQERYWLRVVARETPCKKGAYCDDVKCIYGHRCPFPVANEGSSRGSGMCLNGDHCRFPRDMHGVDTKIVKTIRATGAF